MKKYVIFPIVIEFICKNVSFESSHFRNSYDHWSRIYIFVSPIGEKLDVTMKFQGIKYQDSIQNFSLLKDSIVKNYKVKNSKLLLA